VTTTATAITAGRPVVCPRHLAWLVGCQVKLCGHCRAEIRARYATGDSTLYGLGRRFGVTTNAIWRVIHQANVHAETGSDLGVHGEIRFNERPGGALTPQARPTPGEEVQA
jgi:hypothetical protein